MQLTHKKFGTIFTAEIEANKSSIQVSKVKILHLKQNSHASFYKDADFVVEALLSEFVENPFHGAYTKEHKKELAKKLKADVKRLKQELAEKELAIKMCQSRKNYFKEPQKTKSNETRL